MQADILPRIFLVKQFAVNQSIDYFSMYYWMVVGEDYGSWLRSGVYQTHPLYSPYGHVNVIHFTSNLNYVQDK